jgi:hypothetical protein
MKTTFAERAGTWWRGGTCTGGRWEPPLRPADPRRVLAYEKDVDVAIFANIQRKATTTANVVFAGGRNSARGSGVVRRCTQQPAKSQYKCT